MPGKLSKVAIIGANGKVGRLIIEKLKEDRKHFDVPLAIVRNKEQVDYFKNEVKIDASLTSIEHSSAKELANALKGCDAVIFTAGAGGTSIERIFTVDLDGCVKTVEACESVGIKRLIVVSAVKAEHRDFWWNIQGLRNYYIAKRAADHDVRQSKLDYTIVQPGWLKSGEPTGKLQPLEKFEEKAEGSYAIERADVASFIIQALLHPEKTARKTIELANGNQPIDEFIHALK
ncbi:uncharacterized protein NDAI_0H02270 [Naumovozyma dairenensis CBS 421]|uniref:NAD(P)-binding domain-containing protein n=1 Tax=Naumovozyma dairenensis (strain ATCC 10597 / BCRC 20456 / CBS 421 / NBRC 0211 / NRRL Y-12639) TaxID=1071378 RepID=G0WF40_NAUDC|nr:hypothetical protein NDAI_0H02270 [Naumovozyma dairenensis CBS 421]CCD26401.1 hypothetical protein NDAI_0H02270 [Naumovozyma dairenensis CBS 421]